MRLKRLLLILSYFFFLLCQGGAQNVVKVESLNVFFAGIPLTEGVDSCKQFILKNPSLGIDSITEKSIYSSLKPGTTNHFPFPDSVQVKIAVSVYKGGSVPVLITLPMNTQMISIGALFGTGKSSGKASTEVYRQLKKTLHQYYSKVEDDGAGNLYFSKGENNNFPNCLLVEYQDHSTEQYHVFLQYWELKK